VTSDTKPTEGWNVYLLVISLALIAYGVRAIVRGPSYVGAFGFGVFILLTGFDLVSALSGDDTNGAGGWPLILLIVGALTLVGGFIGPRIQNAPPPPPPAPPGPQPPQ
jgi:hypothetical protein